LSRLSLVIRVDTHIASTETVVAVRREPAGKRPERLESVDLLRGVVMIVMALDHVRDFWSNRMLMDPTDLQTTTAAIFLTRWITHYCAPTFIFLAGTAAFLSGTRGKSKRELSWFLFTRGLWLAFFEVSVNRAMWMFNYDFQHHGAGVFWAIGWAMVLLAVLVYLPTALVTLIGVTLIGLHNLFDGVRAEQLGLPEGLWINLHQPGGFSVVHAPAWIWDILHSPGHTAGMDDVTFGTGYCLIPWMGVMAAGYGFGVLLQLPRDRRRPLVFLLGAALTLAFIILRAFNQYGDPRPWEMQSDAFWTLLSFLNCTKYPASLLYLLMTLGPAIAALAIFDRPLGALGRRIVVFGRVPFFFYLLHIPLIHGGAVLCDWVRFGWSPLANNGPWFRPEDIPPNYGVSLPIVYLVWIAVVLILYAPCRWFAGVKGRRRDGWLSYV
jgi:uncharacterized membrane protein